MLFRFLPSPSGAGGGIRSSTWLGLCGDAGTEKGQAGLCSQGFRFSGRVTAQAP